MLALCRVATVHPIESPEALSDPGKMGSERGRGLPRLAAASRVHSDATLHPVESPPRPPPTRVKWGLRRPQHAAASRDSPRLAAACRDATLHPIESPLRPSQTTLYRAQRCSTQRMKINCSDWGPLGKTPPYRGRRAPDGDKDAWVIDDPCIFVTVRGRFSDPTIPGSEGPGVSPGMRVRVIDDIASVSPPGLLSDPTIPESERAPSVASRSSRCNAWGPLRPGTSGSKRVTHSILIEQQHDRYVRLERWPAVQHQPFVASVPPRPFVDWILNTYIASRQAQDRVIIAFNIDVFVDELVGDKVLV